MPTIVPIHPEGPRYTAPILFLPGLWVRPDVWRNAAGFLGHRGWRGEIVDLTPVAGGIAARAQAVARHVRTLEAPPVLVGIDAGAALALAVAREVAPRALVLVSPLVAGAATTHAFVWSWRLVWSLVRGGALDRPQGPLADALYAELPEGLRTPAVAEPARFVADLARGSGERLSAACPTLVLRGDADPLVPDAEASALASALGADVEVLPGAGHWLVAEPRWQSCVRVVHRWLVRRLGETLLELYAEAMAERDEADGD
jgi:pimeloyl-ACP methyl ester carboxylesterase